MSRYLERADFTSRLLTSQFEALEDRSVSVIDESWRRIFVALDRTPSGGLLGSNFDDDDFMLTDAFTLADDLTFERTNADSIRVCMENARENARHVRNVVGKQIWSLLNTSYLGLKDTGIEDIWHNQPRRFYRDLGSGIRTLFGVMDSTMYRDHGWYFAQLGRFVERVQLVASLIRAQYEISAESELDMASDWYFVLQVCEANLAYRRLSSVAQDSDRIADFLVRDSRLSHSIGYSLSLIKQSLDVVSEGRQHAAVLDAKKSVERMISSVNGVVLFDESVDKGISAILNEILDCARQLNNDIDQGYFNYEVSSYLGT